MCGACEGQKTRVPLGTLLWKNNVKKDTKDNNEEGEYTREVIESKHQEASGEGYISNWK